MAQHIQHSRFIKTFIWLCGSITLAIFAFMAYCSFPVSDDFIMAQDTHKGFLWSITYWLGFWLSAWFTVALEVSIPMAFGYLDYGIWFFCFQMLLLWLASYAMAQVVMRSLSAQGMAVYFANVLVTLYLLFAVSISETVYWQIGAIAYTWSFITFLFCVAAHLHGVQAGMLLPPKQHTAAWALAIVCILLIFGGLVFTKNFKHFIHAFDAVFAGKRLYIFWLLFALVILFLIKQGSKYLFYNFILAALAVFLSIGSGPQFVIFTNAYLLSALGILYLLYRRVHLPTLLLFCISVVLSVGVLLLPGTKNRVNVTTGAQTDQIDVLWQGAKFVVHFFFVQDSLWMVYLLVFLFAGTFSAFLKGSIPIQRENIRTLVHIIFALTFCVIVSAAMVIFLSTKGYFPPRLIHNFTSLFIFATAIYGLFIGALYKNTWLPKATLPYMASGALTGLFLLSPNAHRAIREIASGEPLQYRAYKLQSFEAIKACQSDTCQIPFKKFNLSTIQDQAFIMPYDWGFVLSHKLFVSRYFGKEYIYYDPATIPVELKSLK
jgi:hypothetical protein